MATHSSILTCRIPWAEQPGGLQSMRSQRVREMSERLSTAQGGQGFKGKEQTAEQTVLVRLGRVSLKKERVGGYFLKNILKPVKEKAMRAEQGQPRADEGRASWETLNVARFIWTEIGNVMSGSFKKKKKLNSSIYSGMSFVPPPNLLEVLSRVPALQRWRVNIPKCEEVR